MMQWMFGSMTGWEIAILALGAVLVGINKTGIPAFGIVVVVLFAQFFPASVASAAVLPLLCLGDMLAVLWYRRSANWRFVGRLLPWALVGLGLGALTVRFISDNAVLSVVIGGVILLVQLLSLVSGRMKQLVERYRGSMAMAAAFGILAGFTTQVANAAGPVMAIYLLLMNFSKEEYIGSAAWYFLILNWIKLPLFALDGRLSPEVLRMVPGMVPFLVLGAALGVVILHKLPHKWFQRVIQVFVLIGAIRLLWMGLAALVK